MLAIVTLFRQPAERENTEKSTPHMPVNDYAGFVIAEDSVASALQLNELGLWSSYGAATALQRVLVALPDGVHYGLTGRSTLPGYYADYSSKDGNACSVPVTVGTPARVSDYGSPAAAFQAAVDSGIWFGIPQPDGSRKAERARVCKVGEVVDLSHGESFPKGKITVADIRTAAGLTQQQLSDATGIPLQTLQQIESGEVSAYAANAREKLAEALNFYDYQSIH